MSDASIKVMQLLDELEDILETASKVPFSDKAIVDSEEISQIISDIRLSMPKDIQQAQWVKEESVKEWMEDVIHRYGNLESPAYCLTYIAGECMKRKNAFLHLFRSAQKDVFLFSLNKMACGVVKAYVDEDEEYKESSSEGKERVIRCYKCLFVGIILDWLEENASFDLPEFCEEICKTLAESAPHMMGRYPNE